MMRPALLVVGVLAAFAVGALVWYGWAGDDDGASVAAPTPSAAPQETWSEIARRLGAINRDRLAICVDVVDHVNYNLVRSVATQRIRQGLASLSEGEERWWSEPQPVVDAGCPSEPALYASRDDGRTPFLLTAEHGQAVDEPSYYDLFVFVIPPGDIEEAEGDDQWRFSDEEFVSEGDTFYGVTHGLYLSHDEVCDRVLLASLIEYHLGIRSDYPLEPTPYYVPPMTFGITPTPVSTPTPRCY